MFTKIANAVAFLGLLFGPIGYLTAATPGGSEQLVESYLEDVGAIAGTYTITPVDDDYIGSTFPGIDFFAVHFRLYPQPVLPPDSLPSASIFFVQDENVAYLASPSDLRNFFFDNLFADVVQEDAGRSWLRMSQEFSQDGFFRFSDPQVDTDQNTIFGVVLVTAGGRGEILASLTFDENNRLIDIEEVRDVRPGIRPI